MNELKQQWRTLRATQPGLRIRDAALRLGVCEAALLETRIGDGVRRLKADVREICAALPGLGTVMSLVRNQAAVHEKDIAFGRPAVSDDAAGFSGEDFSLELAPAAIAHAFHVEDAGPKGRLRSIQLFDAAGDAAWKIYARDKADQAAFERLVEGLAVDGSFAAVFIRPAARAAAVESPPVTPGLQLQSLLERAAEHALPLRLDVANHVVRQGHRGPVHRIVRMGSWLNVLDPGFDWHLDENGLAATGIEAGDAGPRLVLRMKDGGEAAVLAPDDAATDDQKAMWHEIAGRARRND